VRKIVLLLALIVLVAGPSAAVAVGVDAGPVSRPGSTSAPLRVLASASAENGVASSLVVPRPAGVVNGDLLLAVVNLRHDGTVATEPIGWTRIGEELANTGPDGGIYQRAYWRVAAAEPASYTWTFSAETRASGAIVRLGPVRATNPVAAHGTSTGMGATVTAPAIDILEPNALVVVVMGTSRAFTSILEPLGMEHVVTRDNTNGNGGTRIRVATRGYPTPGVFLSVAAGFTLISEDDPQVGRRWVAHTIVIRAD